jgi:hypothetical protein
MIKKIIKSKKNIFEHASNDNSFPEISSAKNFIPDWYKETNRFISGNSVSNNLPLNMSFKMCSPFLDSFMSGYMLPLPVDIGIDQSVDGPVISWNSQQTNFVTRRSLGGNEKLPVPMGCSPNHYVWATQHTFKIPKGYSALVTHPFNRYDLPFITQTGIVDGEFFLYPGNIPVFFSSTFKGIIKAGTPIAQILLFKTENWKSKKNINILDDATITNNKTSNSAFGYYKNNHWKKKTYE